MKDEEPTLPLQRVNDKTERMRCYSNSVAG